MAPEAVAIPPHTVAGPVIDGVTRHQGERVQVTNPANGNVVGEVCLASEDDVDDAVTVAAAAQRKWAAMGPIEREPVLQAVAAAIRGDVDAIAALLSAEQGKPLADSRKEILFGADVIDYYATEATRQSAEIRNSGVRGIRSIVERVPFGVVGAITPWNYPVDLWAWKIGGALAGGNAVVVKPPVETPLAVHRATQAALKAGLPPGLLANLPGDESTGRAIIGHSGTALITVTASTATGRAAMAAAAPTLTPVLLELGGHAPFIVTATADIAAAAAAAARRSFSNMGQICVAVNRLLVDATIADRFAEALVAEVEQIELGDPLDPDTRYGPVTVPSVATTATRHIADAIGRGARVLTGSPTPLRSGPGLFVTPTVLDEVSQDALVANEETFGPVVAIRRTNSIEEAIAEANSLPVGLAAYLFGSDIGEMWQIAERLEFGMIGVNVNDTTELRAPFGGWKMSGFGSELGPEGLAAYQRVRHIRLAPAAHHSPAPRSRP